MRKVVLSLYVTLDGVIELPHEWSFQYWTEEIAKFKYEELFAADALLLGRVTYEGFAAAWPTMEGTGEFGERMNNLPKYVATRTLTDTTWNASLIQGDVVEEVARLKQTDGGNILIGGSGNLAQTLMRSNLIDEYQLLVYPTVRGQGQRLFEAGTSVSLKLVETRTFASGVVLLHYQPADAQ